MTEVLSGGEDDGVGDVRVWRCGLVTDFESTSPVQLRKFVADNELHWVYHPPYCATPVRIASGKMIVRSGPRRQRR